MCTKGEFKRKLLRMSQFDEAFNEFKKNPTPQSLECFATQIDTVSRMLPNDQVKTGLLSCMGKILKERQFDHIRNDETMLRLYNIMCRVSTTLGGRGIYEQLEKKGVFSGYLNFYLQWANECAKVNHLESFEKVLNLARSRLGDRMDMGAIEEGFRDLADEYFPENINHLFLNPDDTMNLFDTRVVPNNAGKKSRRRSSVCHLRQAAPISISGNSVFGAKTRTNMRSEFIDTADCYGVSVEEFRFAQWKDAFGQDVESDKRRDSGVVSNTHKPSERDILAREAVENRMNTKKRHLSTLCEKSIEEHEDEKRSRVFSPVVPTKDAKRQPLRNSVSDNAPPTITLSSDTKVSSVADATFEQEKGNMENDWQTEEENEKLRQMAAGKREGKRSERTLSTSSHYSTISSRTAKSGVGLDLMAENNCLEAHAMFSDTVHLGAEKTLVIGEETEIINHDPTKSLAPTQLTNITTDFSVLCDPDPTMHIPTVPSKKTSNGLNVVYDDQAPEEPVKEAPTKFLKTEEEMLPPKSLTTPPTAPSVSSPSMFEDDMFDDDDVPYEAFARISRGNIVTSTPATTIPFVGVEEYFGCKNEEDQEQQNEPQFVAPSSSTLHRMLRRKSQAAPAVPPPKPAPQNAIQNSSIECLSENFGKRMSLGEDEIRQLITEDAAETTGIKNRRRSEVMRGDVNPWDEDLRKKLMTLVRPPTNMHEFPMRAPKIQANRDFEAGGEKFRIQSLIGQGGYAKVYRAENEEGKIVAVKYEVPSCAWEVYICDQMRNRLLKDGGQDGLKMADWCIMQVMDAYVFSTASLLVNEYHEYGTLLELSNNMKDPNWHITCFLVTQMAQILKEVHASNIIHGDIKPDNFIITRKIDAGWGKDALMSTDSFVVKLIDWGRAIDMRPLTGRTFKGRAGTEGFDSPEMIDGRSWTYQADFFGFAATMAVLVTGKYAELRGDSIGNYSLNSEIKRRNILRETIVGVTERCLNISSCDALPDWNDAIAAFETMWNEKFEATTWRQAVVKFNEACEKAANTRT